LTKLVSENKTNWDEHISKMFFSYRTTYKVITWYTPYQLVYGLHPLMLIDIMPVAGGEQRDSSLVKILANMLSKLEKL
jgi:hypothetical protein